MVVPFSIIANLFITRDYTVHSLRSLVQVVEAVGLLGVTLPVATLVSLLVEAPILRLEKLFLAPGVLVIINVGRKCRQIKYY